MSSPLPVPSKVAVTAIRGLLVGTSCSLVLITEDRRRRINNARSAVENAQRIKSARNYRSGGGDFALALEEEALLEPGLVTWTPKEIRSHTEDWARRSPKEPVRNDTERQLVKKTPSQKAAATVEKTNVTPKQNQPTAPDSSSTPPIGYKPLRENLPEASLRTTLETSQRASRAKVTSSLAFPRTEEILSLAQDPATTRNPRKLDHALCLVHEALAVKQTHSPRDDTLIRAASILSITCQSLGRFDDAGRLLGSIIPRGDLSEEEYYSFGPLNLIEQLVSEMDSASTADTAKLGLATSFYLPTFAEKPSLAKPEAFDLGRKLLAHSFTSKKLRHVDELYWRCLVHRKDDYEFTQWFLERLHENHEHRSAIKYFLLCYSKMSPSQESIYAVGDVLVESVMAARDFKAGPVLKALEELCAQTCMLKTAWVIKLLSSHWQRHGDFEKTEQAFDALRNSGLKNIVAHPDGVYRVMMEIAFKAGRADKAESYFDEIVNARPELASDVRLLGLVGLHKAKIGDWDGVRTSFEAMRVGTKDGAEAYGEVFVPILKVFSRNHTTTETEEFLRLYIDELNVPIIGYTVTLMANHYGAVRDIRALVQWLKYCAESGFKVDAAFSNAILANCRRRWKFPFRDLRTMFLKLRDMSPEFADKCTEGMMMNAALSDPVCGGRSAVNRVLSLNIDADKLAVRGKCVAEREVVLAMRQQLTFGRPGQSLRIYKRALHLGMDFSPRALRLAVQATLRVNENNYEAAYRLIRQAQRHGDVSSAAVPILASQLRGINSSLAEEARVGEIRKLMSQLQDSGITVSDIALNLAALACSNAGFPKEAVEYALGAAKAAHDSEPCYNMYNFSILVSAYAEMGDLESLSWVISKAKLSDYWTEPHCLRALKRARRRLSPSKGKPRTKSAVAAREVIVETIEEAVEARKKFRKERHMMQKEMIEIMKKAAAGAQVPAAAEFEDSSLFGAQPRIMDLDLELEELGFEGLGAEENIPLETPGRLAYDDGFRKVHVQPQLVLEAAAG